MTAYEKGSLAEAVARMPAHILYFKTKLDGWAPHSVTLGNGGVFDFDYCKRDRTVYWSKAGGGSPLSEVRLGSFYRKLPAKPRIRALLYVASSLPIRDDHGRKMSANRIARFGYQRIDEPLEDPFLRSIEVEQSVVWCDTCEDMFPDENLCDHLWWCSEASEYVTKPTVGCDCYDCEGARKRRARERLRRIVDKRNARIL